VSQITNIGTTEFCQGKTMRWGLAWTFDPNITFPVGLFYHFIPHFCTAHHFAIYQYVLCCWLSTW